MSWHKQARCSGLGQSVFYGTRPNGGPMSSLEVARAKKVCATCPVQRACLEYGMEEDWGIWGGMTKPERDRALEELGSASAVVERYSRRVAS